MRVLRVNRIVRVPIIALVTIVLLPVLSCTGDELYFRYQQIDKGNWYRDSTLLFPVDSLSLASSQPVYLSLEITTSNGYPYRDLWLLVEQNLTDTLFLADTLRVVVADESGRRKGSSAGGLYQLTHPWQQLLPVDLNQGYVIRIRHMMLDDPLPGIERAGVKIVAGDPS
ncbi:MAG: gliding motility lipoprotein GldH [Proteiniphilum sp.]|nr:gliding motility lipoprotein GldH [Proteiniphilum sp.]